MLASLHGVTRLQKQSFGFIPLGELPEIHKSTPPTFRSTRPCGQSTVVRAPSVSQCFPLAKRSAACPRPAARRCETPQLLHHEQRVVKLVEAVLKDSYGASWPFPIESNCHPRTP